MSYDPDKALDAIAEGMQAIGTEGLLAEVLDGQKERVVQNLLQEYRSNTLTTEKLWAGVGAISHLDTLRHRLSQAIRKGRDVANQLTEDNRGP